MRIFIACLFWLPCAAPAATFSYSGAPLSPDQGGGTGARAVTLSFAAARPPAPGHCALSTKFLKYDDGARSWARLHRAGYKLIRDGENGPVTYAKVCLGGDGATLSGTYSIAAMYSNNAVTDVFTVNNTSLGDGGDLVEFQEYLGGEPHITSDDSTTPGVWRVTP